MTELSVDYAGLVGDLLAGAVHRVGDDVPGSEPGWSDEGKRFRALEREAAATEIGVLRDGTLHVDRFQNRFPRARPT